jgi:UDP-glucose 4-epimerase
MHVLVTGGAGYIGSHTVLELLRQHHTVSVVDNLANSSRESLQRVEHLANSSVSLYTFDLRDSVQLNQLFSSENFDAVIHLAGLKAVGESVAEPLKYYEINIGASVSLAEAMQTHGVRKLVFSSSATVYGEPSVQEYTELLPISPVNPYGQTKAMIEQIFRDLANTHDGWQISLLRYFNPVGADASGQIGEDPLGIPNNLFPFVAQVAVGTHSELRVFGDDYDTPDGTAVRDYTHVTDIALGHIAALEHIPAPNTATAYNLGSGVGSSVLDVIKAFSAACGKPIPYRVVARRPGDVPSYWANPAKANSELAWHISRSLETACIDTWKWQSQNPQGFASESSKN